MYTISKLAKLYQLSRSTLLYYDSIGLLCPSDRSRANYRIYSEDDRKRLETIHLLRQTGMPLEDIGLVLEKSTGTIAGALKKRLSQLNNEIQSLRDQQKVIVSLLKSDSHMHTTRLMDKERWVSILRNAGLDDNAMERWHKTFEEMAPEAHQDFLESLGMEKDEIRAVRNLL